MAGSKGNKKRNASKRLKQRAEKQRILDKKNNSQENSATENVTKQKQSSEENKIDRDIQETTQYHKSTTATQTTYNTLNKKVKVKYVLDKKAKKFIIKVVSIVCAVFIAALCAVLFNIYTINNNTQEDFEEEPFLSPNGILIDGVKLINDTHKFDNYLKDDNGIYYAKLYDTYITAAEANVLTEQNQYPTQGIFAKN